MPKTTAKSPRVTRDEIERYLALESQRTALQRQANDLKKQADELAERFEAFVRLHGGKERSIPRSGFVLSLKTAKGYPSWKNEFIRVAGQEAVAEVESRTPSRDVLNIERAA